MDEVVVHTYKDFDSRTDTTHWFHTNDETIIVRWVGESNGYYSEDVSIEEIGVSEADLIPPGFSENTWTKTNDEWLVIADYWEEIGQLGKANLARQIPTRR